MEGFLFKKGSGVGIAFTRRNWKKRYFILENSQIKYYENFDFKNDEAQVLKGVFSVLGCEVSECNHHDRRNVFMIKAKSRSPLICQAETPELMREWMKVITEESITPPRTVRDKLPEYYEKLNLDIKKQPSSKDVRQAYKRVCVKAHPDKGGNQLEFELITEAHDIIQHCLEEDEEENKMETLTYEIILNKGSSKGLGLSVDYNKKKKTLEIISKQNFIELLSITNGFEIKKGDIISKVGKDSMVGWPASRIKARLGKERQPIGQPVKLTVIRRQLKKEFIEEAQEKAKQEEKEKEMEKQYYENVNKPQSEEQNAKPAEMGQPASEPNPESEHIEEVPFNLDDVEEPELDITKLLALPFSSSEPPRDPSLIGEPTTRTKRAQTVRKTLRGTMNGVGAFVAETQLQEGDEGPDNASAYKNIRIIITDKDVQKRFELNTMEEIEKESSFQKEYILTNINSLKQSSRNNSKQVKSLCTEMANSMGELVKMMDITRITAAQTQLIEIIYDDFNSLYNSAEYNNENETSVYDDMEEQLLGMLQGNFFSIKEKAFVLDELRSQKKDGGSDIKSVEQKAKVFLDKEAAENKKYELLQNEYRQLEIKYDAFRRNYITMKRDFDSAKKHAAKLETLHEGQGSAKEHGPSQQYQKRNPYETRKTGIPPPPSAEGDKASEEYLYFMLKESEGKTEQLEQQIQAQRSTNTSLQSQILQLDKMLVNEKRKTESAQVELQQVLLSQENYRKQVHNNRHMPGRNEAVLQPDTRTRIILEENGLRIKSTPSSRADNAKRIAVAAGAAIDPSFSVMRKWSANNDNACKKLNRLDERLKKTGLIQKSK